MWDDTFIIKFNLFISNHFHFIFNTKFRIYVKPYIGSDVNFKFYI